MIEFFRDVLDGPLYILTSIISLIFIMAIIGFMMERKKLEEEKNAKVATVSDAVTVNPVPLKETTVEKVESIQEEKQENITEVTDNQSVDMDKTIIFNAPITENISNDTSIDTSISNSLVEDNPSLEVKTPVIVFEDPDENNNSI